MSGKQPSQLDQVVQGLRGLRLQGKSLQAREPGNQALAPFPSDPGLVAELVRILVAVGLVPGDRDRGVDGCAPVAGGWLAGYLETGEDAPRSLRWQRLELKVQGGPAEFFLEGACSTRSWWGSC